LEAHGVGGSLPPKTQSTRLQSREPSIPLPLGAILLAIDMNQELIALSTGQ